jgi:hypothetical protein
MTQFRKEGMGKVRETFLLMIFLKFLHLIYFGVACSESHQIDLFSKVGENGLGSCPMENTLGREE